METLLCPLGSLRMTFIFAILITTSKSEILLISVGGLEVWLSGRDLPSLCDVLGLIPSTDKKSKKQKTNWWSLMWWYMPIIPAIRRLK
jgi:hypothetical protein